MSARHIVVDVTSQRARLRGETRVDIGLRGHLRNTEYSDKIRNMLRDLVLER